MGFDISLQLYTVRDSLASGFLPGLEAAAKVGFQKVEFAGFGGHSPAEVAAKMRELGLTASGAHVPHTIIEDPDPIIEELKAIDCTEATVPWLPEDLRASWSDIAKKLNDCAHKCADKVISLGFHNHAVEFENNGLEQLIENAPDLNFQLDVYWAAKAGHDPVDWIERLTGRMPSIHCKDLGEDGADIEIDEGVLDWKAILAAADHAGVKTLVMEMDTPRHDPMESARRCLAGIRKYL